MKVLLLHHFETIWEESLNKFDTSFEDQMNKYIDYILSNKDLDKVIVTRFEGNELEQEHQNLISCCEHLNIDIECIEYAYGWDKSMDEDLFSEENEGHKWCYGNREYHDGINDVLIIDDWMKDLKGSTLFIGGAFSGECVNDILTAMKNIDLELIECKDLIVGEYVNYDFKNQVDDAYDIVNNVEELYYKYCELNEEYDIEDIKNFKLLKDSLLEIEDGVNSIVHKNIDLIKILNLEEDIYAVIADMDFLDIVESVINTNQEFKKYTDMNNNLDKNVKPKIKKIKNF